MKVHFSLPHLHPPAKRWRIANRFKNHLLLESKWSLKKFESSDSRANCPLYPDIVFKRMIFFLYILSHFRINHLFISRYIRLLKNLLTPLLIPRFRYHSRSNKKQKISQWNYVCAASKFSQNRLCFLSFSLYLIKRAKIIQKPKILSNFVAYRLSYLPNFPIQIFWVGICR